MKRSRPKCKACQKRFRVRGDMYVRACRCDYNALRIKNVLVAVAIEVWEA